jgi:hypothetical protein
MFAFVLNRPQAMPQERSHGNLVSGKITVTMDAETLTCR